MTMNKAATYRKSVYRVFLHVFDVHLFLAGRSEFRVTFKQTSTQCVKKKA